MRSAWLALVLTMAPAAAQRQSTASDKTEQTITVTGTRLTKDQVRAEASTFVGDTGILAKSSVARWALPVCPHVLGLSAQYAAIVEAKVRKIAHDAGVPLAPASCKTNLAISFADDGADLVRRIAARQPLRLNEVPERARDGLLNGTAPVRWWYGTELGDTGGAASVPMPPIGAIGNGEGGGSIIPMTGSMTVISRLTTSLVSTQVYRGLTSASVVIDVNRATGVPLNAVAAYVAFVGFAEMRLGAAPHGSILALFDPGSIERDLTESDKAFLKALYSIPLDRTARQQRGLLVAGMTAAKK